jgi:XTP/dITP diphosphohydrolase
MDLTFVSTNAGKFREVQAILAGYGVDVRWNRRELPEVQAPRLEDVVRSKLDAAAGLGPRVLVEDSGLFIQALHGFPGVYSAYALQTLGLDGILRLTKGRNRHAVFRAVVGLSVDSQHWTRAGECRGMIAPRALGSHGFGFDPIFIPAGESKTFGQFDPEQKNRLSHRARAIHRVGRLIARIQGAREKRAQGLTEVLRRH